MNISEKFTDKQLFDIALRVKCEQDDINPEEVFKKNQKRYIVNTRMMISKLLMKEGVSHSDIGRFLKKKHSTIIHYRNLHDDLMKTDEKYNRMFQALELAFRFEIFTGDAQQWRDFVQKANEAYNRYGWGVETIYILYEIKQNLKSECLKS